MAAQRQIPGGPYANETGTAQRQIPGEQYVNETSAGGGSFKAAWAKNSNQIIQNNAKVAA